ncbi:MAG: HAD-IA family hydrolase [Nitrospirota bacterium]
MEGLLIFDLDGTLVDSREDIAVSVNLTLKAMSFPFREHREIYGYIGGGVHNLIYNSLPEEAKEAVPRGVELFWRVYKEHVLDSTRAYPGMTETLETLTSKKAVATNKPLEHARLILDGLGMSRYFINVQGWTQGLSVKPDPQIVLLALHGSGVSPSDAVMVGDGINDILASKAAGIRSCAVGYGYGGKERLMEAGPDYFAAEVGDLVRIFG